MKNKVKLEVIDTAYGKQTYMEDKKKKYDFWAPQRGILLQGLNLKVGDVVEISAKKVKK